MVTIFNRKELIITMDINRQAEIRTILSQNNIDYYVKTINSQSANMIGVPRGQVGSLGIEYKIYVHKKDFEKAEYLIGK